MKVIGKCAEAIGVFSPIFILLFVCSSYLNHPACKNLKPGTKNEIEQKPVEDEGGTDSYYVLQPLLIRA